MPCLFVYGTLKAGFPNEHVMKGDRIPGRFFLAEPMALYLVGDHHTPWLVRCAGQGHRVEGELYAVPDSSMPALDALEDIGQPLGYRREKVQVNPLLSDGQWGPAVEAEVYLQDLNHLNGRTIRQGPLAVYTLAHAALYRHD